MSEQENRMYTFGRSEAQKIQANKMDDPIKRKKTLLEFAKSRDDVRPYAENGNLEEALANYLDGYLSVWD